MSIVLQVIQITQVFTYKYFTYKLAILNELKDMATNTVTMVYDFLGLCLCFIREMCGEGEEGKLLEVTALFIYMCLCACAQS